LDFLVLKRLFFKNSEEKVEDGSFCVKSRSWIYNYRGRSKKMKNEWTNRRVIMLGDAQVGKTAIVQKYINGTFSTSYQPTTVVDFFNKLDVVTEIEQQTSGNIGYVQLSEFTKSANVMAMVGDPQELLNDLSDDLNDDFADIRQTAASIAHAASYAAANANTIAHNAAANANVIAHNAAANANTIAHDAAANVSTIVTAANVSSIAINASTIATTTATNAGSFIASSTSATVVNLANIATNTGSFTSETVGNLTNIVRSSLGSKEKTS